MPSHKNPDVQIRHIHIASATNILQTKGHSKSKALLSRAADLKSKSKLLRQFVLELKSKVAQTPDYS